ncbi:hypothetical protein [Pseudoalteromonas sp. GB56]
MKLSVICLACLLVLPAESLATAKEQDIKPTNNSTLEETADYLRGNLDVFMQDTATWLDSLSQSEADSGKARAKGYLQLSWLPRRADLADFDTKFKVKFYLPKWKNRISLVLDNDDEDDLKLDYEAEPIDRSDSDSLNIALQSLTEFENLLSLRYRLGLSRGQLYARAELKKNYVFDDFDITVSPRIDYFSSDGWAPGVKSVLSYPIDEDLLSVSISWQKLQFEQHARQKAGMYWVRNIDPKQLLVAGVQYNKYGDGLDSYLTSVRYRENVYKDWAFIEIEPFVEFRKLLDYRREVGIGLRFITSYGN